MIASRRWQPDEVLTRVAEAGPGEPFDPRSLVFTGSNLRSLRLSDGTRVIVKHIDPEGDWLSRATNGINRPQQVWRTGVLQRLEPVVETGIIGIIEYADHDAIVMRDLSEWLFAPDAWIDAAVVETLVSRLARLHELASTIDLPNSLCTIAERATLCNPTVHDGDRKRHAIDGGAQVLQGAIDYLVQRLGGAAGDALASFFDGITAFEEEVNSRSSRVTLLHGDLKLENLGLHDRRLVAVDWGELTGVGPPELDVVRFASAYAD